MVEIANLCLDADNKNEVIHSKDVVVKAIDAITPLGKVNHQMTFERMERLKNALSEDYKTISEQLLGEDLADNVEKVKATHSMNQSISNKRLRLSSSSARNPTFLYSSNSKASTSTTHSLTFNAARRTSSARSPPPGGFRSSSLG